MLSSARPRLRRRTRIVSCPAQDGVWAHARYGPSAQHFRRRCVSDGFWETQVKDPVYAYGIFVNLARVLIRCQVSTDTEDNCSDSLYITAQSHFTEPVVEQFKTIMQVLDAESGVIFDKIFQVSMVHTTIVFTPSQNVFARVLAAKYRHHRQA